MLIDGLQCGHFTRETFAHLRQAARVGIGALGVKFDGPIAFDIWSDGKGSIYMAAKKRLAGAAQAAADAGPTRFQLACMTLPYSALTLPSRRRGPPTFLPVLMLVQNLLLRDSVHLCHVRRLTE